METDYPDNTDKGYIVKRNIRQIRAIVDTGFIQLKTIEDKTLVIGSGSLDPFLVVDGPISQSNL